MKTQRIARSGLIVGIIALLISWVPGLGALAGIAAIVLGIISLIKKSPKLLSFIAIGLGVVALIVSLAATSTRSSSPENSAAQGSTSSGASEAGSDDNESAGLEDGSDSSAQANSHGLTAGMASVACDHASEALFPDGVQTHWVGGMIAETLENDAWFLKVEITPKDGQGNDLDRMVMECTVAGSEDAPEVLAFDAY